MKKILNLKISLEYSETVFISFLLYFLYPISLKF